MNSAVKLSNQTKYNRVNGGMEAGSIAENRTIEGKVVPFRYIIQFSVKCFNILAYVMKILLVLGESQPNHEHFTNVHPIQGYVGVCRTWSLCSVSVCVTKHLPLGICLPAF